jgi:hypothetical protein
MKRFISSMFLIFGTFPAICQFPEFKPHIIGEYGNQMGQTSLVDIDQDGDIDWFFGESGRMSWFEYQTAERWVYHFLGEGARTDMGGCNADINRDGKMDFFCGTGWYKNTGDLQKPFPYVESGTISSHDNIFVDLDLDGKKEIVANSNDQRHPYLMYYKIPDNPEQTWESFLVAGGIAAGLDPRGYGDLDQDCDMDLIRGDSWFENITGKGYNWVEHLLIPRGGYRPGKYGIALKTWVTDMDKDGDLDIVEAECDTSDCRIFWFENRNKAKRWRFHLVSPKHNHQDFHSLVVADFDNDGDPDIFSGGGPMTEGPCQWYIWENKDGKSKTWQVHVVLNNYECHEARAADVDGDGDIDICSKPWTGNSHVYLENKLIDNR